MAELHGLINGGLVTNHGQVCFFFGVWQGNFLSWRDAPSTGAMDSRIPRE